MIRMTRLTDYGIVLLTYFARDPDMQLHNARDLAAGSHLPLPMVNKTLKALTRKGLLISHRGVKGGYSLARRPEEISIADIITATEGALAMRRTTVDSAEGSAQTPICPVHSNWQKINAAIREALDGITLAEIACPLSGTATSRIAGARAQGGAGAS